LKLARTNLVLAAFCLAAAYAEPAPGDDAKELLDRTCTGCHKLTSTLSQRNSRERWAAIVDDMVARGAQATDAEIEKIIDYLAKNLGGKVNVNKASASELAGALEIPTTAAASIVQYREKNGAFRTLDDLRKVPGIDGSALDSKKDRIDFGAAK